MTTRDTVLTALVTATICVLAWVAIPLPFLSVPFTGQMIGVLIAGPVLGPARGVLALVLYLFLGLIGFPVFAGGGSGPAVLMGPTGGFLFGFVVTAGVTGVTARVVRPRRRSQDILVLLPGVLTTFGCGAAWPVLHMGVSVPKALAGWVAPFLLPALLKVVIAAEIVHALRTARPDLFDAGEACPRGSRDVRADGGTPGAGVDR